MLMKLTYDPKYDVAHIQFREKTGEVDTIRLSEAPNRRARPLLSGATSPLIPLQR